MKTVIIIPTYNEALTIEKTLDTIFEYVEDSVSVLIVDDHSPDGTADVVHAYQQKNSAVKLLERQKPKSFGQSYIDGFQAALSDPNVEAIFEMDADLSHHPKYLNDMISALKEADVVIGSRYIHGGNVTHFSRYRLLLSKLANIYARMTTGLSTTDATAGFVAYRRNILQCILKNTIQADGYGFQIEMKFRAMQCGARFKEIPITFTDRTAGSSKMSKAMMLEGLLVGARLMRER